MDKIIKIRTEVKTLQRHSQESYQKEKMALLEERLNRQTSS